MAKELGRRYGDLYGIQEIIKWMESKRPIDVEPCVPLNIITDPEDEYVLEYIVPHMPGVEPYIPEEAVIDVEKWGSQIKECKDYHGAEAILVSK